MYVVTISSKYQITIPKEIREQFGIRPGDKALFIPHGKAVEVLIAHSEDELEEKRRQYSLANPEN